MWHMNSGRKLALTSVLDAQDVMRHCARRRYWRPYAIREEPGLLFGHTHSGLMARVSTYHTQYPAINCVAWSFDDIEFDTERRRYVLPVRLLCRVWPWDWRPQWWRLATHRLLAWYLGWRDRFDPLNQSRGTKVGVVRTCAWAVMKLICR